MKLFIVLFAIIAAAFAAPQYGYGSGANAGSHASTFNQGRPMGFPGASGAQAGSHASTFNQGGGFGPSGAQAGSHASTFNQGYPGGMSGANAGCKYSLKLHIHKMLIFFLITAHAGTFNG